MNCPICNEPMKHIHEDKSFNPDDNNKAYMRTLYQCIADDAWVTTEIASDSSAPKISSS